MFQPSKVVKRLFYANIIIFILGIILESLRFPFFQLFALYPQKGFMIHQLITHQFLHGGVMHILFNMLALVSVGPQVEDWFGSRKFTMFYLISGVCAALFHIALTNASVPMVGASGAIFGVLLMFALISPNQKLYFFGLIGMKSKWMIGILFGIEVYMGFFTSGGSVAHLCHVGGGITGILLFYIDKLLIRKR